MSRMHTKGAWTLWGYVPRLFPFARPYWRLVAGLAAMTVVETLMSIAHPWPLAFMVDSVLGNHQPPAILRAIFGTSQTRLLVFAALAGLVVTVLTNGAAVLQEYIGTKFEQNLVLDFRSRVFEHAQRLPFSYH